MEYLNSLYGVDVPLLLMNSFKTEDVTLKMLNKYRMHNLTIHSFMQARGATPPRLLPGICVVHVIV